MYRHEIRVLNQVIEFHRLHATIFENAGGHVRVKGNHPHVKPLRLGDKFTTNPAEADNPHRLSLNREHRRQNLKSYFPFLVRFPFPRSHRPVQAHQFPGAGEDKRHGVLGDFLAAVGIRVRNTDAVLSRRFQVNGLIAGTDVVYHPALLQLLDYLPGNRFLEGEDKIGLPGRVDYFLFRLARAGDELHPDSTVVRLIMRNRRIGHQHNRFETHLPSGYSSIFILIASLGQKASQIPQPLQKSRSI